MENAVLTKDLRRNLFRRRPIAATALLAVSILALTLGIPVMLPGMGQFGRIGASYFGASYYHAFDPLFYLLLPIVAPAFAAGAFAREREIRTWDDIVLTRLTGGQILLGKYLAALLPTLVVLALVSPPLLLVLITNGFGLMEAMAPLLLAQAFNALALASFYIAVSLFCSYYCGNLRTALGVSYVALFAIFCSVRVLAGYVLFYLLDTFMAPPEQGWLTGEAGLAYSRYYTYRTQMLELAATAQPWLAALMTLVLLAWIGSRLRARRRAA